MAYNRMHASKLCNETEFKLFSASLAPELERLPMRSVQANIKRVRTARDKQSDLLRRQTIGVRRGAAAKTAPTATVNKRTEQKVKLFDEALKRFEARFAQLQAVPATANATPVAGARTARSKASAVASAAKKPAASKAASRQVAVKQPAAKRVTAKAPAAKKMAVRKPGSKNPVATKPLKKLMAKKLAVKQGASRKDDAAVGETAPKKPVRSSKAPAKQPPKSAKAGTARAKTPSIEVKAQMQRVSAHQRTSNAKSQARRNQR